MFEYFIIVFTAIVYSSYIYLIYNFRKGFIRLEYFNKTQEFIPSRLSCIIPFRNEENNISKIIHSLKNQNLNSKYFEVILIDDYSSDNSFNIAKSLTNKYVNFKLIKNTSPGKKHAIKLGIEEAANNNLITTDADCIHHPNWLLTISQFISIKKPDLVIAPVVLSPIKNFLDYFQHLDFLSLIISGAGACGINKPIMCNGANLIFTKTLYLKAGSTIFNNYTSGDDIFLLQFAKSIDAKILFLKNQDSIVKTEPVNSLKDFITQRVRWASKSKGYKNRFTLFVAWNVFMTNFISSLLPLTYFISINIFTLGCIVYIIKLFIDFKLLKSGANFFKLPFKTKYFLISQFIYPYYITTTVFYAAFGNVKWKDRNIHTDHN